MCIGPTPPTHPAAAQKERKGKSSYKYTVSSTPPSTDAPACPGQSAVMRSERGGRYVQLKRSVLKTRSPTCHKGSAARQGSARPLLMRWVSGLRQRTPSYLRLQSVASTGMTLDQVRYLSNKGVHAATTLNRDAILHSREVVR
jgi:hypothetical protein